MLKIKNAVRVNLQDRFGQLDESTIIKMLQQKYCGKCEGRRRGKSKKMKVQSTANFKHKYGANPAALVHHHVELRQHDERVQNGGRGVDRVEDQRPVQRRVNLHRSSEKMLSPRRAGFISAAYSALKYHVFFNVQCIAYFKNCVENFRRNMKIHIRQQTVQ